MKKVLAISGSLRQGAYNTALLKAAHKFLPQGYQFDVADIDVPHYSEDIEQSGLPGSVQTLKQQIAAADYVVISTPEYNHSFSGVLKNALDWASRPAFESPFKGKKVAILTASKSPVGGARAQAQLRLVLASMLCEVYPGVEYMLANAHEKFDADGELIDETAQRRLQCFITDFIQP